jgi:hypothetical protein
MAKIREVIYEDGTRHLYYQCPGCNEEHPFSPLVHKYNENPDRPTVKPSLLLTNPQQHMECHSYITNGVILFCTDKCWHGLNGQSFELKDYPADVPLLTDLRKE